MPIRRIVASNFVMPADRIAARLGGFRVNLVHVIPPNATLTLEGDMLRVSVPAPAR